MWNLSFISRIRATHIIGAIVCVLLLVIIIVGTGVVHASPAARDDTILAMVILGILGTFGLIAYYYTKIGFGAGK